LAQLLDCGRAGFSIYAAIGVGMFGGFHLLHRGLVAYRIMRSLMINEHISLMNLPCWSILLVTRDL
jgi:hypothetical protein